MATSGKDGTCVLEPLGCETALFACLRPTAPLSLFDLEALTLLTDATILFDEIIFLDTNLPTIRFQDSPRTRNEQAKALLENHLKWDFFKCDVSIRDYPQTPLYVKLRSTKLDNEYDVKVEGRVRITRKIKHPMIGYEDWSVIAYLDKVNSSAASLGATVVHRKSSAVSVLERYQQFIPSLTAEFINCYDKALKKRFLNSSLRRHREMLHYAPLFLASAISTASPGKPEGILSSIAQMRAEVTSKYRSLCDELLVIDQRKAERVVGEIEKLLRGLGQSDKPIPRSRGYIARSAIACFRPVAAVTKIIQGDVDKAGEIMDAAGTLLSGVDDIHSNIVKDADLYRRLNFFNRLHAKRPTSDEFYKDLKRVFVQIGFSHQELDQFLGGLSPNEIYQRRSNL